MSYHVEMSDWAIAKAREICEPSYSGGTRVDDEQHIRDVAKALDEVISAQPATPMASAEVEMMDIETADKMAREIGLDCVDAKHYTWYGVKASAIIATALRAAKVEGAKLMQEAVLKAYSVRLCTGVNEKGDWQACELELSTEVVRQLSPETITNGGE